ncbi:hypothetical protein BDZ94DRAFT_1314435 [Collybia nuda]|uniref:Uncharacterized protein n=1 Tax=Collybia nuda TaxID=64659 RepID=A0A9P6CDL7_9AGAR|nr:hypothetical protein BDZ94DRAFT_1314435 [Collybia nuda]
MDTDWCLNCDCHFQGTGPYCSTDCQDRAGPSTYPLVSPSRIIFQSEDEEEDDDDVIYHRVDDVEPKSQWTGNGSAGILAWASEIPSTPSTGTSTPITDSCAPSPFSSKAPSRSASSTFPSTALPSPSRPILTPQQHLTSHSLLRSPESVSMGKTSLLSGATESSLATPASAHAIRMVAKGERPSFLGSIANHVRSWVAPSPLIASPASSHPKQRITAALNSEPQKFTILAHSHHPATLNIAFSSQASSEASAQWHLSSTILVDTPTKPPPRSRGRKPSRAIV